MAILTPVVRKMRQDGFYPVYIRICHRGKKGYIETDKVVNYKSITTDGKIKDSSVNVYCHQAILRYTDMLNRLDISQYTVGEVIEYLTLDHNNESFSRYAAVFITRILVDDKN